MCPIKDEKNKTLGVNARRRQVLFDMYCANLSIYFPDVTGTFVCPVCFGEFDESALASSPLRLVLGHLVPKALRGKLTTLVCRACENDRSAAFDRALADEKKWHAWSEGERVHDARINTPEGNIAFELTNKAGKLQLHTVEARSNPDALRRMISRLTNKAGTTKNVRFQTFDHRRRDLGYLYHAFLVMFDYFGYEYAMCEQASRVRDILSSQEPTDLGSITWAVRRTSAMPKGLPAVNVLMAEEDRAGFLVSLPPMLSWEGARCVFLPGPTQESGKYFDLLMAEELVLPDTQHLAYVEKDILLKLDDPISRGQMPYFFDKYRKASI